MASGSSLHDGEASAPSFLSKIDMVTAALRGKILRGEITPGTALRQREVADMLGVSVTPVREALRRLESEGVVTYDPHCGATVVEVDFGPTEENFRVRATLESLAASMAAERVTDDDLADLEALYDRMLAARRDPATLSALNRDFHFRVYDIARSPLLRSLIGRLWRSFGVGPVLSDAHKHIKESMAQHARILEALRARDPVAAEEATREHILTGINRAGAGGRARAR